MSSLGSRHPALLLVTALLAGCMSPTETSLNKTDDEIRTLGYTAIRPPTNLPATGSVVLVRSAEPFVLQVVCGAGEVIGPIGPELAASGTVSSSWQRQSGVRADLSASYLDKLNAKLGGKFVRGGTSSLSNARVTELSDAQLRGALNKPGAFTEDCRESIKRRLVGGATLTLVQSALVADVTYALTFETGVDVGVKATALRDIAPELNAEVTDEGQGMLKGEALIWGIRDDAFLMAQLGLGREGSEAAEAIGPASVLPLEAAAVLPPE